MTGGTRRGIVVSTLAEARFFAAGGFDDILYAYPLPFDKLEECAVLAQRLEAFQVLVDSRDALAQLRRRRLARGVRWLVWMKLDCGNGRGTSSWRGPACTRSEPLHCPLWLGAGTGWARGMCPCLTPRPQSGAGAKSPPDPKRAGGDGRGKTLQAAATGFPAIPLAGTPCPDAPLCPLQPACGTRTPAPWSWPGRLRRKPRRRWRWLASTHTAATPTAAAACRRSRLWPRQPPPPRWSSWAREWYRAGAFVGLL